MCNAKIPRQKSNTPFSCYWCKTCDEYMRRNFEPGDECGRGEIYENDPDGWNEICVELSKNEQTN